MEEAIFSVASVGSNVVQGHTVRVIVVEFPPPQKNVPPTSRRYNSQETWSWDGENLLCWFKSNGRLAVRLQECWGNICDTLHSLKTGVMFCKHLHKSWRKWMFPHAVCMKWKKEGLFNSLAHFLESLLSLKPIFPGPPWFFPFALGLKKTYVSCNSLTHAKNPKILWRFLEKIRFLKVVLKIFFLFYRPPPRLLKMGLRQTWGPKDQLSLALIK